MREELTEGHRGNPQPGKSLGGAVAATVGVDSSNPPEEARRSYDSYFTTAHSLMLQQRTAYPEEQFHNSAGVTEDGESLETQGTFHPDKTEGSALVDAEFPTTTYHLLMCPA